MTTPSRATSLEPDALASAWAAVQASGVARDGKLDIPAPSADVPARLAAADLLTELAVLVDGEAVDPPRVALYMASAGDAIQPAVPWTGPLDLATAGTPVTAAGFERCAINDADHAAAAAEIGRSLAADALVIQDDARWVVGFRPLFADEPDPEGCGPA